MALVPLFHPELIESQLGFSFRLVTFVIFLAASTLFIGFNHKVFELSLGERSKSYFWLFMVLVLVPILLVIYAFSYFFGSLFPQS